MTSFGWKRKSSSIQKTDSKVRAFATAEQAEDDNDTTKEDFDWIAEAKKRRVEALEDNKTLVTRLRSEGVTLAEEGKYWQAINRQEPSTNYTIDNYNKILYLVKSFVCCD